MFRFMRLVPVSLIYSDSPATPRLILLWPTPPMLFSPWRLRSCPYWIRLRGPVGGRDEFCCLLELVFRSKETPVILGSTFSSFPFVVYLL